MTTRSLSTLAAAGAIIVAPGLAAQESVGPEWARVEPAKKQYSAQTPCTEERVIAASVRPLMSNGLMLQMGSQVVCEFEGHLFASGLAVAGKGELENGQTAYDMIMGMVGAETRDGLQISHNPVDGRRASQSRETVDGTTAQTTIIEFSPNSVLMVMSGGPFGGNPNAYDVAAMIDRHIASFKVPAK